MYLLVDIGGTNLRTAVSSDGKTIKNFQITATPRDPANAIAWLQTFRQNFQAIIVGLPGLLSADKTSLSRAPNLPAWINYPLRQKITDIFHCPVFLANDAALAGLGEAILGAGHGYQIIAFLTISTGLGGARIVRGHFDETALGFEPGHQIIDPAGPRCSCGGYGHLEAYVSGAALAKKYRQPAANLSDPAVWQNVTDCLAIGLNNLAVLWSPHCFVLGGPLVQRLSLLNLQQRFHERCLALQNLPLPVITKAELGDKSGLHGALCYLRGMTRPLQS
jgi:predicted NBD/HSP70 family sugar kinase